jgi:poly(hydroxyalkanoate) depolymerase family esterase
MLRTVVLCLATLASTATAGTLAQVPSFGANPGALAMWRYTPDAPAARPALVVVMHGCTQDHTGAAATGWNQLADAHGFYVVYPEQSTANNPLRCFNWAGEYGDPANLVRGQGENQSIAQMVATMIADHGVDPDQVFVAGFSAGGAMVPVMLATWPDVFAAGAVLAGVPYRCGTTVTEAFGCQQLASHAELQRTPAQWAALVRTGAPDFSGTWPRVAIFHGSADTTVSPANQAALVAQWTELHGGDQTPDATDAIGTTTRERYRAHGDVVVESYAIAGMGHAVAMGDDPVMPCAPMGAAYVEDRDLCAAARAVDFFGIADLGDDGDPDPPGDDAPPGDDDTDPDDDGMDPIPCGCGVRGARDGAGVGLVAFGVLAAITRRRRARCASTRGPASPSRGSA